MTLVGIAVKNIFRNKLRTTLTVLGVAVSIVAFIFLRTIIDSWTAQADQHSQSRILTRHKVSFIMQLPLRYIDDVKKVPHVKIASYGVWFGLYDPNHESEFFPSGAEDDDVLARYGQDVSVPADQEQVWRKDRRGLAVGKSTADKFGWKVGDKVNLVSRDYPNPPGGWQFTVDAIWTSPTNGWDEKWIFAHYDYLNDALPPARQNQIQWIVSAVDDPMHANDVAKAIDQQFQDRELQTMSQDEKSFSKGFLASMSAILSGVNIISFVILGIMALIVGNTIAMGVRERTSEYGVLRALGFPTGSILVFIFGEAIVTGLLGGLIGLAIAIPVIDFGMGPKIMKEMGNFFAYFRVPPMAIVAALGLSILIGAAAAAVPAFNASRLKAIDAIRRVA